MHGFFFRFEIKATTVSAYMEAGEQLLAVELIRSTRALESADGWYKGGVLGR